MHSIIYRSVAQPGFERSQIYQMLSISRSNNKEKGITGCLLYHKNQFVQLLEGELNSVTKLYQKILDDTRHDKIETLKEMPIERPLFKDWSMAFHDFGALDNGTYEKSRQLDAIFNRSSVFDNPSKMALNFFKATNKILFAKN